MLVREAAAGGALEPAGQEGETGLPRRPGATALGDKRWDPPCGCHVPPDLSLGLAGTPRLLQSCWRGSPAVPGVPRYSRWGDRGGCPWDPPPTGDGPVPNAGDQRGCPRPAGAPSPTVSASPAACKRRAGLDGAAAPSESHQGRLGDTGDTGPSLRPGLNPGAAICTPKSPAPPILVYSWGSRAPQSRAGVGSRSQEGTRGGCGFVATLKPAMGAHF